MNNSIRINSIQSATKCNNKITSPETHQGLLSVLRYNFLTRTLATTCEESPKFCKGLHHPAVCKHILSYNTTKQISW